MPLHWSRGQDLPRQPQNRVRPLGDRLLLAFAGIFDKELWLPATIVFAVSPSYTLTLFKIKICVCPRCGHDAMIPLDTPKAAEIMEENHLPIPREFTDPARTFWGFTLRDVLLILTSILVAIILYKEFR